jgi:hypothetical protein
MTAGRPIALRVGVALLATMVLFASSGPARAQSCSPQDIWNNLSNAWESAPTCTAACASGFGCFAAFAIAGAIGTAQAAGSQGAVNTFCTDVNNAASDASAIVGDLQSIGAPQSLIDQVTSALGSVADPLAAAQCACEETTAISGLITDISNCIVAGLCDVSALFGTPCGCTQPPTTLPASCQSSIGNCGDFADSDPACQGGGPGNGPIMVQNGWSAPVMTINTPGGTEVIQSNSGSAAFGTCGTSYACFCPKPMVPTWVWNYANDSNAQGNDTKIFACVCPAGTSAAGATPQNPSGTLTSAGLSTCLCPNTGQPIMTGYGATVDNPCPTPLTGNPCPSGQIRFGNKCINQCAQNQVMTPDGTCCNPIQASSCGQCCPPGMTPDPANGTCRPVQPTQ